MTIDFDAAYRVLQSKDSRFDGMFFVGVSSTGIYCRPSCSARTPLRRNVGFYPSSAAAQRAGFRACKRCRPDATPGSADWNSRADLAGRAVRLIADGVIDRVGVSGLAQQLGYSERQVTRTLVSEMGAPPLALARAQRAQTARILLESSTMSATDVAFAAGFASVRQFNDTIREVFDTTPTGLRKRRVASSTDTGTIELRLAHRPPMDLLSTLEFLGTRAVTGVESFDGTSYSRVLPLPHGPGLATVRPADGYVRASITLSEHRDLAAAVARLRRLLDLDSDPVAVDTVLSRQPLLRPLIQRRPGLRSPGAVDSFEMVVRAIVGQQVSVAGARTVLGRLTEQYGRPAFGADDEWRLFPTAMTIADVDPSTLPMPRSRGRTIVNIAAAMVSGELQLDAGSDRAAARATLLAMPGIGSWTADYLLMRAVGDPDIYLDTDLGIKHALGRLYPASANRAPLDPAPLDPAAAAPWRSYLTHHLWASLGDEKPLPNKAKR